MSTPGGVQSTIFRAPSQIIASQKEYTEEYHVTVKFDVSEYERSATEKILFVQLVVHEQELVDEDRKVFATDKQLAARGLPIYVFESSDEAELLGEEGSAVGRAIAGTEIGRDGALVDASGRMTKLSELDEYVLKRTIEDTHKEV